MTHQAEHPAFDSFYEDHVEAHRNQFARETLWERATQPSILISILILVATVGYNLYGSSITPSDFVSLLRTCLWDALVLVVPESLINALDDWMNPTLAPRPASRPDQTAHAAKSEKMRRVLGLDRSGGVMASVFQVRSRALSMTGNVLGLKVETDRPPGLGNRDNSCYQNSILQGLASLKPLPGYLESCLQAAKDEEQNSDVAQTLRTLIADLNDASNNGRTIWTPSLLKSMSTWTQQDAQEYFSKILDDVDKSVAKAAKIAQQHPGLEQNFNKDDTAASQHSDDSGYQSLSSSKSTDAKTCRNPLEGLLAQRVACVQCGHTEGLSMIPFTCLTLSLGLNKNQHDLYERLDAYCRVEPIENVECAKCTLLKAQKLLAKLVDRMREARTAEDQLAEPVRRLEAVELALEEDDFDEKTLTDQCKISAQSKVTSTKTKQIVVARPPQSLAVHMNRSVFDPSTFNMMKNSAPVNFPRTLDLGPWCLGSTIDSNAGSTASVDGEELWSTDPRASMIAGDLSPSKLTGPIYELRAVVTHYGRHENGHYICYRKYPRHAPPPQPLNSDEVSLEPGERDEVQPKQDEAPAEVDDEKKDSTNRSGSEEMDWWRLSDHNVTMVDEETVLSLSPGVFMLFYDCVDPNMVLNTENADMQDAAEDGQEGGAPAEADSETCRQLGETADGPEESGSMGKQESLAEDVAEAQTKMGQLHAASEGPTPSSMPPDATESAGTEPESRPLS